MTDRNLIFRANMVRALLKGRKTQTRRVVKPRKHFSLFSGQWSDSAVLLKGNQSWRDEEIRYRVGDRIWVRESWSGDYVFRDTPPKSRNSFVADGHPYLRETIWYWADGNPENWDYEKPRPSIHMPRWASRLTLIVTDVRVQRLQDISEEDARAEGIFTPEIGYVNLGKKAPVIQYAMLWNSLHGPDAWDANPWVSAITFTVHHGNIDQMRAA
jgi:hypothetical protein